MKTRRTLYAITVDDVVNVSKEINIPFSPKNLHFIEDKIGDFFGSQWYDAVDYALTELKAHHY